MTLSHFNGNGAPAPVLPLGAITLSADHKRPPASPAVELTKKGEAYAASQSGDANFASPPTSGRGAAREQIEASIEQHLALVQALIAWLDDSDGDPDLEPSLAGFDGLSYHKAEVDLEDDELQRELDTADNEPSLGWTDMESRYGRLSAPTFDPDREEEHDGAEPDNDDEDDDPAGGDVQDEPHDPDTDLEHSLGWGIAHQSEGQQPAMLAAGLMGMEGDREADYCAGSVYGISAGIEAGPEREQGI